MLDKTNSMKLTEKELSDRWWKSLLSSLGILVTVDLLVTVLLVPIVVVHPSYLTSDSFQPYISILIAPTVMLLTTLFFSTFIEHRSLLSLGFFREKRGSNYLKGLGLGTGEFLFVLIFCLLFNSLTISINPSINWMWIVIFLFGFAVQGLAEEVFCRGFLMNAISSKKGVEAGIILNSLFFALLHVANPNISLLSLFNLFIVGLLFSLLFYLTDNIWLVGAAHSVWNFLLGPVFGIEVSGMSFDISIFKTISDPSKSLINGGTFGLEGGIVCTFVTLLACTIVYYLILRKNKMV